MTRLRQLRTRWKVGGVIASVVFLCSLAWFARNHHFYFDSHHLIDEATFSDWLNGWFHGWESGPLYASVVQGPSVKRGAFSERSFSWFLRRAEIGEQDIAWLESQEGLRFAIVSFGNPSRFLVHSSQDGRFDRYRYQVEARHVGGQPEHSLNETEMIYSPDVAELSWNAWEWNRWEFNLTNGYGHFLGHLIKLPDRAEPHEWAFSLQTNGETKNGERRFETFVIKRNVLSRNWELFENANLSDSWMDPEKQFEIQLPPGFE